METLQQLAQVERLHNLQIVTVVGLASIVVLLAVVFFNLGD